MANIKRKLASIQKIKKITPIQGADFIEKATILGYSLCVKKGEFKVGDKCIYFECDSVLPDHEIFSFLKSDKFRVVARKFRGQISMGLALPLSSLEHFDPDYSEKIKKGSYRIGTNVTDIIGVLKYYKTQKVSHVRNPIIKYMMKYKLFRKLYFKIKQNKNINTFPSFIPKTDIIRIQSLPSIIDKNKGRRFYVTEKLDGSSATFFYNSNLVKKGIFNYFDKYKGFGVCSKNRWIVMPDDSIWWKIERNLNIFDKLEEYCKQFNINIAIQGEIIGNGVQKNIYDLPNLQFRIFSVWDIDQQVYYSLGSMIDLCIALKLTTVPITTDSHIIGSDTIESYNDMADFNSALNSKTLAEGIVCKDWCDSSIGFKCINPKWLIKNQ